MIEWLLCGLRGFIKQDMLVAMGNEGTGSSLGSVGGWRVDGAGGVIGMLDDGIVWLQ